MGKNKVLTSSSENIVLEIAENNLSATLTIKSKANIVLEQEILSLIEIAGIKNGFDTANKYNKEHNLTKDKDAPFMLAYCPLPEKPKIYYLFNQEKCIDPENIKTIFQLSKFMEFSAGDPVADVSLSEEESVRDLIDIFGDPVNIEEINSLLLENHLGEGVYYDHDSQKILCERPGYVYLDSENKISIISDLSFCESVSDSNLELKGNIVLNGNIDNSTLNVDGNLTINGEIRNCSSDWSFINGNIYAESIENSHIACNGALDFVKTIRFSIIAAEGEIKGAEESSVIGGLIQSGKSVDVSFLGSPFSITTEVDVTVCPYFKMLIRCLKEENDEYSGELQDKLELYSDIIVENLRLQQEDESSNIKGFIKINKTVYSDTFLRVMGKSIEVVSEQQNLLYNPYISNS